MDLLNIYFRMEEESIISSPSPTDSNTTFSATLTSQLLMDVTGDNILFYWEWDGNDITISERNMLDETRLSDRSMMNITRSFVCFLLAIPSLLYLGSL